MSQEIERFQMEIEQVPKEPLPAIDDMTLKNWGLKLKSFATQDKATLKDVTSLTKQLGSI